MCVYTIHAHNHCVPKMKAYIFLLTMGGKQVGIKKKKDLYCDSN